MPLPVIPDAYRFALIWAGDGGTRAVSVLHLLQSGTSAAAIASALDANVTTNMWGYTTSGTKVGTVHVTPLDGSSATYILAVSGAKWGGPAVGDTAPAVAGLVSFRTALRGAAHRGRLFVPFVAESVNVDGVANAATVTNVQTAWNTWLAAMIAAGAQPIIASYVHAQQQPISSIIAESVLATQRRRQSRLRRGV